MKSASGRVYARPVPSSASSVTLATRFLRPFVINARLSSRVHAFDTRLRAVSDCGLSIPRARAHTAECIDTSHGDVLATVSRRR